MDTNLVHQRDALVASFHQVILRTDDDLSGKMVEREE